MTARRAGVLRRLAGAKRRMYRGGRPSGLMRLWNRLDALVYSTGRVRPAHTAVLRVRGHRTGRDTAVPVAVAVADIGGAEFLV